jgi:hypothetical protein
MSRLRRLLMACLLAIGAVVSPLGVGVALADPNADFEWTPRSVVAGERVTFKSTSKASHESWTSITRAEWSIEGVGTFEGNRVTVTVPAEGLWSVELRVWDARGEDDEESELIDVEPSPPRGKGSGGTSRFETEPSSLVSPFPVVRLAGSVTAAGATVRILSVNAAAGARVLVRCGGRGCPVERVEKIAGRGRLRFDDFERWLRAGVVLEVFVRRGDAIGQVHTFQDPAEALPQTIRRLPMAGHYPNSAVPEELTAFRLRPERHRRWPPRLDRVKSPSCSSSSSNALLCGSSSFMPSSSLIAWIRATPGLFR